MMENMGLRVIAERPYRLSVDNAPVYVQDFEVESTAGAIDAASVDEAFGETFARVWHGDAENDGFNRLVLAPACTGARSPCCVATASTCCRPACRSRRPTWKARSRYPLLARLLVELFEARFDPATGHEQGRHRRRPGPAEAHFDVLAAGDEATLKVLKTVVDARKGDRDADAGRARCAAEADGPRVQPGRGPHPALVHGRDRPCAPATTRPMPTASTAMSSASSSIRRWCRTCRSRARTARSSCTAARGRYPPAVARGCARRIVAKTPYRSAGPGQGTDGQGTVIVPVGAKGGFSPRPRR